MAYSEGSMLIWGSVTFKKWVWICLNYETSGYFMILHGICSSNMFVGLVPPHGVVEYIINHKSNELHLGKCVPTL